MYIFSRSDRHRLFLQNLSAVLLVLSKCNAKRYPSSFVCPCCGRGGSSVVRPYSCYSTYVPYPRRWTFTTVYIISVQHLVCLSHKIIV
ncbi:hypothetical protein BDV23DRAFT_167577, partial [Aspergillus alliaceus]